MPAPKLLPEEEKTSLRKMIDARGISLYRLLTELGKNPYQGHSLWAGKINGKRPTKRDQLENILKIIGELSPKYPPPTLEDVEIEAIWFNIL